MPSEISFVDPNGNGDSRVGRLDGADIFLGSISGTLGRHTGKFGDDFSYYSRFDFDDIEDGVTLESIQFRARTDSSDLNQPLSFQIGLLVPDGTWDGATAYGGYGFVQNYPRPEGVQGADHDLTVWIGEAPAGTIIFNEPDTTYFTIGDGVASDYDVPGLLAQTQEALDTYGSGPLKLGFLVFYPKNEGYIPEEYRAWDFAEHTIAKPTLELVWADPAIGLMFTEELIGTVCPISDMSEAYNPTENMSGTELPNETLSGVRDPDETMSGEYDPADSITAIGG